MKSIGELAANNTYVETDFQEKKFKFPAVFNVPKLTLLSKIRQF
jgi:hypothetical protein